jgi:hypothetical protein
MYPLLLPLLLLAGCGSVTPVVPVAVPPVSIATSTLPFGVTGVGYNFNLRATDGSQPYTFSLAGGSLPPGLTLLPGGTINGVPSAAGSFAFVAEVADSQTPKSTATTGFDLVVAAPLVLPSLALAPAQVGSSYSAAVVAGGIAPYSFTVTGGALPAGLAFTSSGTLAGTPSLAGAYGFSLTATDGSGQSVSGTVTLTVKPVPLVLAPTGFTVGNVGAGVTVSLSASGGTKPYVFSVASGTLPPGITLSAAGVLSGTFTTAGVYTPTIQVSDSGPPVQTVSANLNITVFNAMVSVNTASALATVPATGFGMHTSVYDPSLSDVAALPALLATTGIKMLRYPGGSYSDNYHWAQYTMTPIFASTSPACDVTPNGYLAPHTDFGYFLKTLAATGTQAIITVNYGSSLADANGTKSASAYGPDTCSEPNTGGQPQEAAAWVAYANGSPTNTQVIGVDAVGFDWKTVGFWAGLRAAAPLATDDGYNFLRLGLTAPVGIRYWELGNEIYYNGYNSNNNAESDDHAPYIYPSGYGGTYDSRAGVPALSPTAYGTNAAAYIQAMRAVDPTIKVGVVVSSAIDPIPSTWTPAVLQAVCGSATFDFAILHYYPGTYNATTAAQLLSNPQGDMPVLVSGVKSDLAAACPSTASGIQIFVTETNPDGTLDPSVPAAVPGLFAAHVFLTGLEAGVANIEWLELHGGAGTFLATGTEVPGPAYYGIELAHLLAGVGDTLVSATSNNASVLVHATQQANGTTGILLINSDPAVGATVQVTVSGNTLGATATQYSYGIGTTQSSAALNGSSFAIAGPIFTVTVPAYTATELLIP